MFDPLTLAVLNRALDAAPCYPGTHKPIAGGRFWRLFRAACHRANGGQRNRRDANLFRFYDMRAAYLSGLLGV